MAGSVSQPVGGSHITSLMCINSKTGKNALRRESIPPVLAFCITVEIISNHALTLSYYLSSSWQGGHAAVCYF